MRGVALIIITFVVELNNWFDIVIMSYPLNYTRMDVYFKIYEYLIYSKENFNV